MALTTALSHPGERIAWLSILHANWCGISAADLYELVVGSDPDKTTIWDLIIDDEVVSRLSSDGRKRLLRFRDVVKATLANRGRGDHFHGKGGWRRWVEGCWVALGGPATLLGAAELQDARTFFDLLEEAEMDGGASDLTVVKRRVDFLYAATDPNADPDLSVMTLHKAKGLEFDVVILPGLDRRTRGEERRLLTWLSGASNHSADSLPILAPIGRTDHDTGDPIQNYIRSVDRQKAAYETTRLLYVAVTRAKQRLHLLAGAMEEGSIPPASSFLGTLWTTLSEPFTINQDQQEHAESRPGVIELLSAPLQALGADWKLPELPSMVSRATAADEAVEESEPVLFDWAGDSARIVGLVVHRFLCRMAEDGVDNWSVGRVEGEDAAITAHLRHLAVAGKELAQCRQRVRESLVKTLQDPRGRWILDGGHELSASESALSGFLDGRRFRAIIDRSFIDADGNRWIIDYKTSDHTGGDLNGFLDNERMRYQDQLNHYARIFKAMEDNPIRLGLYFPMLSQWREWSYGEEF